MSRRRSFLIAAGILGGAVVLAVVMVALRPEPPVRVPPSRAPFVTTAAATALEGAIPVYSAGTVRPRAEIDVAAQINGKVASVAPAFQSGGRVSTGQVLFRIDDADYLNRVQQARANVAAQLVALLQAEEEARIARAEYEGFLRRRGDSAPPGDASRSRSGSRTGRRPRSSGAGQRGPGRRGAGAVADGSARALQRHRAYRIGGCRAVRGRRAGRGPLVRRRRRGGGGSSFRRRCGPHSRPLDAGRG